MDIICTLQVKDRYRGGGSWNVPFSKQIFFVCTPSPKNAKCNLFSPLAFVLFLLIFYLYPIVVYSIVDLCVQEEPLPRHGVDAGLPGDWAAQQGWIPQVNLSPYYYIYMEFDLLFNPWSCEGGAEKALLFLLPLLKNSKWPCLKFQWLLLEINDKYV